MIEVLKQSDEFCEQFPLAIIIILFTLFSPIKCFSFYLTDSIDDVPCGRVFGKARSEVNNVYYNNNKISF